MKPHLVTRYRKAWFKVNPSCISFRYLLCTARRLKYQLYYVIILFGETRHFENLPYRYIRCNRVTTLTVTAKATGAYLYHGYWYGHTKGVSKLVGRHIELVHFVSSGEIFYVVTGKGKPAERPLQNMIFYAEGALSKKGINTD